jgi:glycerol-3-phosphate dehydrogenase
MPIATEVYRVLYEDKPAMEAVVSLMNRPPRHERE